VANELSKIVDVLENDELSRTRHVTLSADRRGDDVRLSDIEPNFVCTACGRRGADVRPKFPQASMGTG
jgi:hypothetical protein